MPLTTLCLASHTEALQPYMYVCILYYHPTAHLQYSSRSSKYMDGRYYTLVSYQPTAKFRTVWVFTDMHAWYHTYLKTKTSSLDPSASESALRLQITQRDELGETPLCTRAQRWEREPRTSWTRMWLVVFSRVCIHRNLINDKFQLTQLYSDWPVYKDNHTNQWSEIPLKQDECLHSLIK